jgi:hypothetical protein
MKRTQRIERIGHMLADAQDTLDYVRKCHDEDGDKDSIGAKMSETTWRHDIESLKYAIKCMQLVESLINDEEFVSIVKEQGGENA